MKTGRLLKFQRPGGEVHAYIYREGGSYRASLFVATDKSQPAARLEHNSEAGVERAVREWVDARFPKPT
jgi:hypothetical protein